MVHSLFSTGKFELYGPITKDGKTTVEKREGRLDELHGRLGFIDWIDLYNKEIADEEEDPDHLSTKESMYRQFLIYRDFYTAQTPVILCEGKTDNVYIKHAIRSLAAQFPDLAEIDDKGKVHLKRIHDIHFRPDDPEQRAFSQAHLTLREPQPKRSPARLGPL